MTAPAVDPWSGFPLFDPYPRGIPMSYSAPEPPRPATPVDGLKFDSRPKRRRIWPWLLGVALLALCGTGTAVVGSATGGAMRDATMTVTPEPIAPPAGTPGKKATKQQSRIGGDDVVHVGEDAPAGTYRTAVPVQEGDFCSWIKSRDAEAQKVIDVGLPPGGRPQVTLKAGQWFTSRGCPDWVRQ